MAMSILKSAKKLQFTDLARLASSHSYEMPELYRNAFYLANASFSDNTNWFVHNALESYYCKLVEELKQREPLYSDDLARQKVLNLINGFEPCNSVINVNFPVMRKSGCSEVVRGFRAHHGLYLHNTPCLGGLRLCKNLKKDDVKALSVLSTYKHACMGISMGGAHGGLKISPDAYEPQELKNIIETFTTELSKKGYCNANADVIEPDINCGSPEMAWIASAKTRILGNDVMSNACAVGKPFTFGGLQSHEKAAGRGIYYGLDSVLKNKNIMDQIDLNTGWGDKTFVIMGLGKVGSHAAKYINNAGAKCIGIKEHDCYLYDSKGIPVEELVNFKKLNNTIIKYSDQIKPYTDTSVLKEVCDILVLAAHEKTVDCYLAENLKAKVIVEAANGPITPSAHKILVGKNRLILPDIFINSGSSIASQFEYVKNLQHVGYGQVIGRYTGDMFPNFIKSVEESFSGDSKSQVRISPNATFQKMLDIYEEENIINAAICSIMERTLNEILSMSALYKLGLDIRTAAYIVAMGNIFSTIYDSKLY